MTSTVKRWIEDRGYGFIYNPTAVGKDIFVHHRNIKGTGHKTLREGHRVEFETIETAEGFEALNVRQP